MKHTLNNDKYDVSLTKINVYIGMIVANKLIHIKNQCKQLDNRSGHRYVSICLTTPTCATCMSTIRYVAHQSQMHMWTCISDKPSNIDIRKYNVYIKNYNANVKTKYVRVTWTQFAFKHKHVKSQCINSWLHSTHCKTICEDVSPNTHKTFTSKKTMLASLNPIQMSKQNMFESHWCKLDSNTNMSNLNVSILDCTPYIAKPYVKMYPQTNKKHWHAKRQCLHHEFVFKCQNTICLIHIDAIFLLTQTCEM